MASVAHENGHSDKTMSQSEYARRAGLHSSTVSRAVKAGRIPTIDGRIDPEVADRALRDGTDTAHRTGPRAAPAEPTYANSRALREQYMARIKRLEFQQLAGSLVRVDRVQLLWFKLSRRARDLVLAIPDRLAPVLAAMSDPVEVHAALSAELRHACTEMERDVPLNERARVRYTAGPPQ